ncbi:MAG TPA: hypothetical protein VF531_09450 [Bacillota bacterium]
MVSNSLTVFGIMLDDRGQNAPDVQEVITRHGSEIIGRMGVPSPSKKKGFITLLFEGELTQVEAFRKEIEEIDGATVQTMSFPQ